MFEKIMPLINALAPRPIVICGGAGFNNAGDEALLRTAVFACAQAAPHRRIVVAANNCDTARQTLHGLNVDLIPSARSAFFRNDEHYLAGDAVFEQRFELLRRLLVGQSRRAMLRSVAQDSRLDFIDRGKASAFLDRLTAAHALVIHGGGILTSATRSRLWEQSLTTSLAASCGVPVLLRSQQLGPYENETDVARAKDILDAADYVAARDGEQSRIEAARIGSPATVVDNMDDAFVIDGAPLSDADFSARYGLVKGGYLSVCYRANAGVGVPRDTIEKFAAIVARAKAMWSLPLAYLPMAPFDRPALQRLRKIVGENPDDRIVEPVGFRTPIEVAGESRMMIAMPHHALIFALRGAAPILSPVAGRYYCFKNSGSMRLFGMERFVVDLADPAAPDIAEGLLATIRSDEVASRREIQARGEDLRNRWARNEARFAAALTRGRRSRPDG